MTLHPGTRRLQALMWFGLLGAPIAWATQHVTGFGLSVAACSAAGRRVGVALDPLTIVVTAIAATIAAAAGVCAITVFRATRGVGDEPPGSRIHFLSIVGMTIAPLFVAIILMSGVGSVVQANCHQS